MTPHPHVRHFSRASLLRSTALQAAFALIIVAPARSQPAANAQPQGGQVVAGGASIARTSGSTVINQSTNRAAIDWRSFDVGRNQSVTFQQPSSASATLNRVTGPDPSAIAGRISANGQVILTNPNGVTFFQGSQVNAQSLIVSAPGITNQNFMAGRMVFDGAAKPGARIENAGTITVKQAGLAALVAPSVANSGTINARLGTVILAGAAAHTLDMYGDGLVSIDVTKQVRQAPTGLGGKPVTALVTNTGTIVADGGSIQLTAKAADGVVQTLVDARGTLQANTLGANPGRIEIAGTGGAVIIAGRISADANGGQAGTIVLNGSTATTLADTAHVTANGHTGGGTIAVGTTLARARSSGPAPHTTSARTTIAAGARIAANATRSGNGGRVTVLSTAETTVAGDIEAKGGARSGDGGTIELSGESGFHLNGRADTAAPRGAVGTIVVDPRDLTITSSPPAGTPNQPPANGVDPNIAANTGGTASDAYVTPAQLQALTGTLHLLTTRDLTVASPLNYRQGSVTLEAGRNLTVASTGSIAAGGNLTLAAASGSIPGVDPSGTLSIAGTISGQSIALSAGTGGIALAANVSTTAALGINTPGALTQTAGFVTTPQMYGTAGSVSLPRANSIDGVGNGQNAAFQTTSGGFLLTDQPGRTLAIGNAAGNGGLFVPAGQPVTLTVDHLTLAGAAGEKSIIAPGSTLLLQAADPDRSFLLATTDTSNGTAFLLTPTDLSRLSIDTLQLGNRPGTNGPITIGGPGDTIDLTALGIRALSLNTADAISQGGPLTVASLAISVGNGVDLSNTGNRISTLSRVATNGPSTITTAGNLALGSSIGADSVSINAGGSITGTAATVVNASDSVTLTAGNGSIPGADPAAALILPGRVSVANTFNVSAGSGGIQLSGAVLTTDLIVSTTGSLSQGTAGLSATTLSGTAGSVGLTSSANAIVTVRGFSTSSVTGDFRLVDSSALTIVTPSMTNTSSLGLLAAPGIATQPGRTIDLSTDSLTLNATRGGALSAPGGIVSLRPYAASTPILLTTSSKPSGTLALTTAELAQINSNDLILGGTNPGTGQVNTGAIMLGKAGEAIDLSSLGFGALGLNTAGAVTQGGPLAVSTLSTNVGSLALITSGNQIGTLAGVSAAGDISLHTDGDLSVGFTQAGGNISLSSGGTGGMTLFGAIAGQTVDLNSLNTTATIPTAADPGITQTGGGITANTLTGAAGATQLGSANTIANLGGFATYSGLQLNNGNTALTITGPVSSTAGAISLTAAGLSQTASASLTTPELDGASTASTTLTASGNAVRSIGTFNQTGGDFTLSSSSPVLTMGAVTVSKGSLTIIADGVGIPTTPTTPVAISAPLGNITFQPYTAGRGIDLIGTSTANPNDLSIDAGLTSHLSARGLILDTAGPIRIGNTSETIDLHGAVGALQLRTGAAVTQGAGTSLVVGTLTGSAGTLDLRSATNSITATDTLSTTAGPLNLRTGGALSANDTSSIGALTITAGGDLAVRGILSAGSTATLTSTGAVTTVGNVHATDIAITAATGIFQTAGTLAAANSIDLVAPNHAITQTGGTMTAATLTSNSATLSLPGANSIAKASVAATGPATLNDLSSLTLAGFTAIDGSVATAGNLSLSGQIAAATLALRAGATITQPGGTLTSGTLSTTSAGQTVLDRGNAVTTLAASSSVGGFTLVDAGSLTVAGALKDSSAITIRTGGDLSLSGTISTGTLTLAANGAISQPGGSLTAASLSGSGTSALLTRPNAVSTLAGFSTAGNFALVDNAPLTIAGPVSVGTGASIALNTSAMTFGPGGSLSAPSGTISLAEFVTGGGITLGGTNAISGSTVIIGSAMGGSINLTGSLDVSTNALELRSAQTITETGAGAIVAATLTGSAGTVALNGPNRIGTLGRFATGGDFSLSNVADLAVNGPVTAANLALTSAGNLTLAGALVTPGMLSLTAGGNITQSGGVITANVLTGSSVNAALSQSANSVASLADFLTTSSFSYAGAGNLTLAGTQTGRTVTLEVSGGIVQAASSRLIAGLLSGTADSAALNGANQIDSVAFATHNGFALTDTRPLTVAGPLTDVRTGITLAAPSITFAAPLSAPTLLLTTPGAVTQTAGTLAVGTLTGRVGSVDLGNQGTSSIGALGSLSATDSIAITDQSSLRIAGPLSAPTLSIAATGALVLDGGSIRTNGQPLSAQLGASPAPGGSGLAVRPGADGTASLVQLGTTTVTSLSDGPATLRLDLPTTGGTLALTDLEAAGNTLVLSLGSGTASGRIRVGQLAVLGAGGSATLTGRIGLRSDFTAAQSAQLLPGTDLRYTFNDCAIAAATCSSDAVGSISLPGAAILSILRPDILTLGILDLTVTRDRDDPTLLLPNISDRDY